MRTAVTKSTTEHYLEEIYLLASANAVVDQSKLLEEAKNKSQERQECQEQKPRVFYVDDNIVRSQGRGKDAS